MARKTPVEISEDKYEEALSAREGGATKKRQCEILNIAYNTSRLDSLLEEYQLEKETRKEMMRKNRSKPVTPQEDVNLAEAYLMGNSLDEMSKRFYRSVALIKRRLEMMGVLELRFAESANPLLPKAVPDDAVSESFNIGDKVWVPGYKCLGEVCKEFEQADGIPAYRVYLLDSAQHRYVTYKAWDLGSLKYLEELGVDTKILEDNMDSNDIKLMLTEALRKARMRARKK